MWRRFHTWRAVHGDRIGVVLLVLNLAMPLIVGLLIWLGIFAFDGKGFDEDCGSGPFKWSC